jgi:putative phage-type endonuclease
MTEVEERQENETQESEKQEEEIDEIELGDESDSEEDETDFILEVCEEYLQKNAIHMSSPDFYDQMVEHVQICCFLEDESLVKEYVLQAYQIFQIPIRHHHNTNCDSIYVKPKECTEQILQTLKDIPQPKQRTEEWYAYRHERFSASNVYKLFGSPAEYNSLIYEKCKPYDTYGGDGGASNANNPRNWGVKYEPVSVQIYEHIFQTRVKSDYGCIPHPEHSFIAASPDGIVINPNSPRYGHMLEIKNIYNREIDGIPFEKYWVQMQIQLETCNLDYCDFLETRFKEYTSSQEFYDSVEDYKGVILYFLPKDKTGVAFFKYMPLYISVDSEWSVNRWISDQQEENPTYFLYETVYWYLDEISCVLVERNQHWFESALPIMKTAWDTVEKERTEGYSHRAPVKRPAKKSVVDESKHCNMMMTLQNSVFLVKLDANGDMI